MASNEYLIPLGADLGPLINDIRTVGGEVTKLQGAVKEYGEASKKAFADANAAQQQVITSTVEANKKAKEQAAAMGGLGASADEYAQSIGAASVKQEDLNKKLAAGIDIAKKQLAGLKEGSSEYKRLAKEIQAAEIGLAALNGEAGETTQKFERMRKTLADNKAILQQMAAQGLQNTKVFKDLERQTGELDDTIKDVNESIALAGSDTKGLDNLLGSAQAITGAFTVAQGAVALFGDENENLEKALLQVNAALSILNGLQAIQAELKRKDSIASRAAAAAQATYATVVGTSTGALKLFRIALASTGIGLIVIAIGALIANFDKVKAKVLELFPGLETLSNLIGGLVEKFTDFVGLTSQAERDIAALESRTKAYNATLGRTIQILEAQGGKESEIYQLRRKQISDELMALKEKADRGIKLSQEEIDRALDLSAQRQALDAAERKRLADLDKQSADDRAKVNQAALDKRKADAEKALAIEKDLKERILALDRQYRDLKIAAIEDETERTIAEENARYQDQLSALQKQVDEFKGSEEQRKQLQEAAQRLREGLAIDHQARLLNIEKARTEARLEQLKKERDLVTEVLKTDEQREIDAVRESYKERIALLRNQAADVTNVRANKALTQAIDDQEAEITAIQEKYQGKREEGARDNAGKTEAVYMELYDRLEKSVSDFFQNAGLSPEQSAAVIDAAKRTFRGIVDAYAESIDLQIEAKQRQVEALTDQIDEVEEELQRELELQEQGYANNVDAKKAEIETLKAEREKQLEDEKRLQKERAKIASLEIAISTVQQSATLAQAAAELFKNAAKSSLNPIVGVVLGIAAAASLITGFMAIKSRIKQAEDQVPKFRKGDQLNLMDVLKGRPSHESRGVGLYDEVTGERIAELEGNEKLFVVNKGSSGKHEDLLRAINNDNFSALSEDNASIRMLYRQIRKRGALEMLPGDFIRQARKAQSLQAQSQGKILATDLSALPELLDELREFKAQERDRTRVYDYPDHVKEVKGNHTKIYKKKP